MWVAQVWNFIKKKKIRWKKIKPQNKYSRVLEDNEDEIPRNLSAGTNSFSVLAPQVSVERLFSGLKFILSPYRWNISPEHLENQLLIRTNRLFEKNYKKKKFSSVNY